MWGTCELPHEEGLALLFVVDKEPVICGGDVTSQELSVQQKMEHLHAHEEE